MAPPTLDIAAARNEFPIVERCNYLVSHSLGAMPRAAHDALATYAREWDERGVRAWKDGWWSLPAEVGSKVATLLDAPPGSIVLQPSVTVAAAVFLSACSFAERRRLVTTDMEFPSVLYLLEGLRGRGVDLVVVESDDGIRIDMAKLLDAITPSTSLVVLSHVFFRSSFVVDVRAVIERAHRVGAMVLLDLYQSAGILPFSLAELGVDAAVGGCLKWLCGGPGNAFLYVRPDLASKLEPTLTGWQAHRDPFRFAIGAIERADGAVRFLHGTPNVSAHRVAEPGLALIQAVGVEVIRAHNLAITTRVIERAEREGWPVYTPRSAHERAGTVSLHPPHAYEVSRVLLEENHVIDFRLGTGIRIGPHVYNTASEVDGLLDAITEILRSGTWSRHAGRERDFVT